MLPLDWTECRESLKDRFELRFPTDRIELLFPRELLELRFSTNRRFESLFPRDRLELLLSTDRRKSPFRGVRLELRFSTDRFESLFVRDRLELLFFADRFEFFFLRDRPESFFSADRWETPKSISKYFSESSCCFHFKEELLLSIDLSLLSLVGDASVFRSACGSLVKPAARDWRASIAEWSPVLKRDSTDMDC